MRAPLLGLLLVSVAHASGATWEAGRTRCLPNFQGETRFIGYRCVKVESGSLYAKMGLASTDNVVEINGQAVTGGVDEAMELWREFDRAPASLTVERGGRRLSLRAPKAK